MTQILQQWQFYLDCFQNILHSLNKSSGVSERCCWVKGEALRALRSSSDEFQCMALGSSSPASSVITQKTIPNSPSYWSLISRLTVQPPSVLPTPTPCTNTDYQFMDSGVILQFSWLRLTVNVLGWFLQWRHPVRPPQQAPAATSLFGLLRVPLSSVRSQQAPWGTAGTRCSKVPECLGGGGWDLLIFCALPVGQARGVGLSLLWWVACRSLPPLVIRRQGADEEGGCRSRCGYQPLDEEGAAGVGVVISPWMRRGLQEWVWLSAFMGLRHHLRLLSTIMELCGCDRLARVGFWASWEGEREGGGERVLWQLFVLRDSFTAWFK